MLFPELLINQDPRANVVQETSQLQYWENLLVDCASKGWISADTETDAYDPFRGGRAIGLCFGFDLSDGWGPRGVYFPIRHRTNDKQLPIEPTLQVARRILGNPAHRVVFQNASFDAQFFRADGIELECQIDDTLIGSHLLDENTSHGLEDLCVQYGIDERAHEHKSVVKKVNDEEAKWRRIKKSAMPGYAYVPVPILGPYGAKDGYNTLALAQRILPAVYRDFGPLYATELVVQRALIDMTWNGVPVDVPYLLDLHQRVQRRLDIATGEIRKLLQSHVFNPSSDMEVRDLLFKHYRLPTYEETRNGNPSVGAFSLKEIRRHHPEFTPLMNAFLEYRDADKISSTYTEAMISRTDDRGRLHSKYNQTGANTGRLSSSDPNLQNISSDEKEDDVYSIKRAFVVPEKKVRVSVDFSQIELRVLAHVAQEPTMMKAFIDGEDIHLRNQIEVFGDPNKKSQKRRVVKVLAFGTSFGMTPMGIMQNLNDQADPTKPEQYVTEEQATEWYNRFHSRYRRVGIYNEELVQRMMRSGRPPTFTNMFGRKRRIWELTDSREWMVRSGTRKAMASMIQGTAADLAKISVARIYTRFKEARRLGLYDASLVNLIHDDNQADVNYEGAGQCAVDMKMLMEAFPDFAPIPIVADAEWTASHWGAKKPVWEEKK